jgi:hypothetical protein
MGRAEWAVTEVPAPGRDLGPGAGGQSIALLVAALLGSLLLVPATLGLVRTVLRREGPLAVRVRDLGDGGRVPEGRCVELIAQIEPSSALELGGPGRATFALVALTERDDVVLFGRASNPELGPVLDLVRRTSVEDPDAVANRELTWPLRTFRGRIHDVDASGYGLPKIPAEDLRAFTRDHLGHEPPRPIRVVDLEEPTERGSGGAIAWVLWAWALCAVASFWGALFWTRRRARDDAEAVTAADLVTRDPGLVTVLCFFTLGVYQIFWNWVGTRALRRIAGRPDLVPGIDLLLSVLTLGLWGVYVHCRNAAIIDALVQPLRPSNVRWQVLGLYLASVFCSLTVLGALYRLAEGYREAARLGRGELGPRGASAAHYPVGWSDAPPTGCKDPEP